tara:strand:- start:178 stop:459 length:282 start_codon:yes stop_codon:yes gene_type:complete
MDKKGSAVLITIIVILAIVLLILGIVNISSRECNNNGDCGDNEYCGTDYFCHAYPDQVVVKDNNYVLEVVIFGIALIVAAYIFKGGKIIKKKK